MVGIGVDNGIHVVHRMRTDDAERLFDTSTMRAVLASGLTTVASFGNLAFSSHVGTASMGILLALGLAASMAATLIVLPAWLEGGAAAQRSASMTVALVTGANGFLGSAVVRALLADGSAVRAFVRPGSDRRNLAGLDVDVADGDLTDRDSLAKAAAGCEAVFHVAADYRLWVADPAPMYRANVEGSVNVLEAAAAAGAARMVYTSSVAVLGINKDRTPADENHAGGGDGHGRALQALEIPGRAGGARARRTSSGFPS